MDSLRVSTGSLGGMAIVFMDLLPYGLGIVIAVMNIVYLYYKIKKKGLWQEEAGVVDGALEI